MLYKVCCVGFVGCLLFVVCCSLFVVGCLLLVVESLLFVAFWDYWFVGVLFRCALFVVVFWG